MEKLYKRLISIIIIPVVVAAFPFLVYAGDSDSKPYDWYFKPTDDNTQPQLCPEATFLSDYDVITVGNANEQTVYLTFDAGYDNGYHTKILDTLKAKNVKAAFFVDGNFVKTNPQLIKRMAEEGHLVCNHSLKHPDMSRIIDYNTYSKQITEWEALVNELGVKPQKYFRFPSGRFSKLAMDYNKKHSLTTVFWSFAYYDWDESEQPSESGALDKIYSRLHNGAVLLLHSTSKTNSEILSQMIDGVREKGYTFKSLDEFKK
ncbi:MAG: polysaccharide deacetylase family protein [Clostridia bacterium]|nr:polysaccharide deacetylase family protein [Clostridia bacterium]